MISVATHRALDGLQFRIAGADDLEQVYDLRKRVYAVDWPQVPLDCINDLQDPQAYHLVAVSIDDGAFVGATRILPPTTRPFDTERYVDVSARLGPERILAEIGRLCLRHDWRRVQLPFVNAGLLALAVRFAQKLQISDLILSALPTLVNLYRIGFFDLVDLAYEHPIWGHLQVMRLDVLNLPERLRNSPQPLARLLLDPTVANIVV